MKSVWDILVVISNDQKKIYTKTMVYITSIKWIKKMQFQTALKIIVKI